MSVEYKVKFTISGETLFALFAKMLPIDNVSIEEIVTRQAEPPAPRIVAPRPEVRKKRKPSHPLRLDAGINGIIMRALEDGPRYASEIEPLLKTGGYSTNSIGSRLIALRGHGVVVQDGDRRWRLATPSQA